MTSYKTYDTQQPREESINAGRFTIYRFNEKKVSDGYQYTEVFRDNYRADVFTAEDAKKVAEEYEERNITLTAQGKSLANDRNNSQAIVNIKVDILWQLVMKLVEKDNDAKEMLTIAKAQSYPLAGSKLTLDEVAEMQSAYTQSLQSLSSEEGEVQKIDLQSLLKEAKEVPDEDAKINYKFQWQLTTAGTYGLALSGIVLYNGDKPYSVRLDKDAYNGSDSTAKRNNNKVILKMGDKEWPATIRSKAQSMAMDRIPACAFKDITDLVDGTKGTFCDHSGNVTYEDAVTLRTQAPITKIAYGLGAAGHASRNNVLRIYRYGELKQTVATKLEVAVDPLTTDTTTDGKEKK